MIFKIVSSHFKQRSCDIAFEKTPPPQGMVPLMNVAVEKLHPRAHVHSLRPRTWIKHLQPVAKRLHSMALWGFPLRTLTGSILLHSGTCGRGPLQLLLVYTEPKGPRHRLNSTSSFYTDLDLTLTTSTADTKAEQSPLTLVSLPFILNGATLPPPSLEQAVKEASV